MSSQKTTTKKKLENMHLRERINYGYNKVIMMMLISGLFSIVVIGVLFANMVHYVENVAAADEAVKICRINVNASARNIREMALNEDTSSYDGYEQTVKKLLTEVDSELKILKKTGSISNENYEEYATALSDWGNIGYSIMDEIKNGDREKAVDAILNDCTPALNKLVNIAIKLDEETDHLSDRSSRTTFIFAIAGIVCIFVCLTIAWTLTRKTSKKVLETILEPLHAVEDVAKELTEGNLHSTLEYRSEDEIGNLAHSMRKSIRILGSYVDDIGRAMKEFSESNGKMREMVDSMHEINDASQEIDKIIATINEIASQTNLLALNASIEAARAGEAGKGFAVVANQVNLLADQSAHAAKESAELIETSVKAVEKGMVIAGQTATQLEDVAESSKAITGEVTNIAETLETQTVEIQQINQGIEQINDVVQSNAATSEECAAASQEMSSEAESLREMIRKFKVAK